MFDSDYVLPVADTEIDVRTLSTVFNNTTGTYKFYWFLSLLDLVCEHNLSRFSDREIDAVNEILRPELEKKGGDPDLTISAIGHAHIDLAWLWPIRETIRKGARTFSTAVENMERYEDYRFGASQPQLYAWVKEHYPALYEKVKEIMQDLSVPEYG